MKIWMELQIPEFLKRSRILELGLGISFSGSSWKHLMMEDIQILAGSFRFFFVSSCLNQMLGLGALDCTF